MKPLWHPVSALLLDEPRCFATRGALGMLLKAGPLRLRYAGDRMWPAVEHGAPLTVEPLGERAVRSGEAVIACPTGVPELLRVASVGAGRVRLVADADPEPPVEVAAEAVLARAALPRALFTGWWRFPRRLLLEFREARTERPDPADDPAQTVRVKYDTQAPFYAEASGPALDPALLRRARETFPPGGRILVVGSGSGRECFSLAEAGWDVTGVDFSPAMVQQSSREARKRGLEIEFHTADIRDLSPRSQSLCGVFFTYDVYSFVPGAGERIDLLRRLHTGLSPDGAVLLSARCPHSFYRRCVTTLHWLAGPERGHEWGRSHTRWVAPDGTLQRSFIQLFTPASLEAEVRAAGFRTGARETGHIVLHP